jgi:Tol biopolymer transport system component
MGGRRWWVGIVAVVAMATSGCAIVIESSAADPTVPNGTGERGSISSDGRYVVFMAPARASLQNAYLHDNVAGTTTRVSQRDGAPVGATAVTISADARFVAFTTDEPYAADDTNDGADVYVRDLTSGAVTRASLRPDGGQFAATSTDFVFGRILVSDDGRYVVFTHVHTQGFPVDGYVRDRTTGVTTKLLTGSFSLESMSGDGLHVSVGHWILDWTKGTAYELPECSGAAVLSRTGRYVAYAEGHLDGDPACGGHTYRLDRRTGERVEVVAPSPSGQSNAPSSISADGRRVAVTTAAALVPSDSNGIADVYVRDLVTGDLSIAGANAVGVPGPARPHGEDDPMAPEGRLSGDGNYVVFNSEYPLASSDTDLAAADVYTADAIRLEVTGVEPGGGAPGATGTAVTVSGHGFSAATTASFGSGVRVRGIEVVSAQQLRVTVDIDAGAAVGDRDVVVTRPGALGTSGARCGGCFTVA